MSAAPTTIANKPLSDELCGGAAPAICSLPDGFHPIIVSFADVGLSAENSTSDTVFDTTCSNWNSAEMSEYVPRSNSKTAFESAVDVLFECGFNCR